MMSIHTESGDSRWFVWSALLLLSGTLYFLPTGAAQVGTAVWWAFAVTALALAINFVGLVRRWPSRVIAVRSGCCALYALIVIGRALAFPPQSTDISVRLLGDDLPPAACYGALIPLIAFLVGAIVAALPWRTRSSADPAFLGYGLVCLLLSAALTITVPDYGQYLRLGAQEWQLSTLTDEVGAPAEASGSLDATVPDNPLRIGWSLPAPRDTDAVGATIAGDVVITLRKAGPTATVTGLDRLSGAQRWHLSITAAPRVGGIAADADTGQVVLPIGDSALILDGKTGARDRIIRMPPAPASALWTPLAGDGSGLANATTLSGTMMPFVALRSDQFGNAAYAVTRLDLQHDTLTDLDRPNDTGCEYRFADTADHSWSYLVRSRCGQTTVRRFLRGETDAEMTMPDAGCELGCRVQSIAGDDDSLTISTDADVTRLDVSAGRSRIDWRTHYDGSSVVLGKFPPESNRQPTRTAVFRDGSIDLLDDNDGHLLQSVTVPRTVVNVVLNHQWLQIDQASKTVTALDTGTLRPLGSAPFACTPNHFASNGQELIATCTDGTVTALIG
jgi:hypothetical protein